MSDFSRIHYLDNLRVIAMMLGVFLHAGFAYAKPSNSFWLATDRYSSSIVDCSIWFVHLFRMSLFFLISGYFSKLLVEKRGVFGFVLNRIVRIGIPFLLFYPILFFALIGVIVFAVSYLEKPEGALALMKTAGEMPSDSLGRPKYPLMHIWFLYYLLGLSILGALAGKWIDTLFSGVERWIRGWRVSSRYVSLIGFGVLPLLLVPAVMLARVPIPAPETFQPLLWPFWFYGLFYFGGWFLRGREMLLDQAPRRALLLSCVLVVGFAIYYFSLPTLDLRLLLGGRFEQSFAKYWTGILLTCYLSVGLTWIALVWGKRFLNRRSGVMGVISDSSYWVYLVHLPLAIYLQTLMVPFEWPLWIKLTLATLGTFLPCLVSYLVFVRYTPIGWLLHGKRSFP